MNLISSYVPTPLLSDIPKYVIIELKGTNQWLEHLQDVMCYELNTCELFQFFLNNFKRESEAIMIMEYSLLEMYGSKSISGRYDTQNEAIISECRKLGIRLYHHLCDLGCFINGHLHYCYCRAIGNDSFLMWRPDDSDVDRP